MVSWITIITINWMRALSKLDASRQNPSQLMILMRSFPRHVGFCAMRPVLLKRRHWCEPRSISSLPSAIVPMGLLLVCDWAGHILYNEPYRPYCQGLELTYQSRLRPSKNKHLSLYPRPDDHTPKSYGNILYCRWSVRRWCSQVVSAVQAIT